MKKVLLSVLVIAFAMPFVTSCKKGAEDPGISFKSRDGRLKGVWKLTKFDGTYSNDNGQTQDGNVTTDTKNSTYTFDGTTWKEVTTSVNKSSGSTNTQTTTETTSIGMDVVITFTDGLISSKTTSTNGTYTQTLTNSNGSAGGTQNTTITATGTTTEDGTWYWLDSKKNKVGIRTSISGAVTGSNFSGNLVKLATKEMIVEDVYSNKGSESGTYTTSFTGSTGSSTTSITKAPVTSWSYKYTFTKQK